MKTKINIMRFLGAALIAALIVLFIAPEIAEARRGGRSFGGRRSLSRQKTKPRATKPSTRAQRAVPPSKKSSFGGTRMNNSRAYTSKYGTPRKTQTIAGKNAAGAPQNYRMHSYGGYGSGLMTGYMMGTTSMLWMMPFHPAFYYSRPYYANNPDGSMDVYPPTFSFSKLLFTIIIIGGIVWIIVRLVRKKKQTAARAHSRSSFR